MESTEKTLGGRIKQVREYTGYNQTDFAALLNVKQSFLSAVERGIRKAPKAWNVVLSKEFGVSTQYLESGVITKEDRWYLVPKKSTNDGTNLKKVQKSGTTSKNAKKGSTVPAGWENDHLFGQGQPKKANTPEEDEKLAQVREVMERHPEMDGYAYAELARIRQNPGYAHTARKLHELREKLRHDMFRTEPELSELIAGSHVFEMLANNIFRFHSRYLNTFADASYNYTNAAGQLSATPVENLTYSEYRETMMNEASKLQPYADAIKVANAKMEEILRLLLPFDNEDVVDQFLID